MTQQLIDLGTGSPSRLSESIRSAFTKVNSNFTEIFTACGPGGNAVTYSNSISSTASLINLGVGDALTNGDTLRDAFIKIVNNFNTLFAVIPISHYNIDLGDGPNTQTGDTVTSAFQKINADFTNLYTTLGLTISNVAVNTTDFGPSYRNRLTIETVSSEYILPIVTEPFGYYGAGQQFIDLGDGPDTQTGDTVREAFIKINANFSDLYQVFGANGETNLIGNTIIANNINVTDTVRAGGFFGYGNVETDGNVIGSNFLYPNGTSVFSNLTADYTHIPSSMIPTANNTFTIGNASLQWASVNAGYYFGNGRYLSGIDATSIQNGTSNVKVYYNANVGITANGTTWTFDPDGIVTIPNGGKLGPLQYSNGIDLYADGTMSYAQVNYNNINYIYVDSGVSALQTPNVFITASTIDRKAYVLVTDPALNQSSTWQFTPEGNLNLPSGVQLLSGYPGAGYVANTATLSGDQVYLSSTDGNVWMGVQNGTPYIGNNNYVWEFAANGNLTLPGNLITSSNVTASYFLGNGRYLSGIDATLISNGTSNVKVYSNANVTFSVNNIANVVSIGSTGTTITGNLGISGNIVAANFTGNVSGNITAPGANTQVLFNDAGTVNATSGFIFNKATNLVSITGNLTSNALTVNNSATVGSTLSAAGGIQNTPIGNVTASTGAFTTLSASSLAISGNAVVGNLDVLGNVTYINSTVTTIVDPIIELNTGANGAPLSGSAPYDSGIKTHYWDGTADRQSFFGRTNDTGNFEYYSNVISETGNIVTGTYGTIKTGNLALTGTGTIASTLTVQGNTTVSAITVNNSGTFGTTLSASGGLQATPIGNVSPSTAIFTSESVSGNSTVNGLTVNSSATVGGTLGVVGNLIAGNLSATNFVGNAITLGTNTAGQLVSNAVTLTSGTSITNSIAQLNYVLGKLVPTAPNNFPGGQSLSISTLSTYRMANFVQTDNTATGGKSVAGGTSVSNVRRATTYTTSTIANVGPGDSGVVTAYRNGVGVGNVTLIAGNVSGTYGNLVITRSGDYANVSNVTPGFWYSFSSSLSGNVAAGWNEVYIAHSTTANTNIPYWYYDSSAPGTPTWSNTNITMTTNSSTYSSTIPHLNSSSAFTLTGNVAKLSGDMFPSGASSSAYAFVTGSAGGALAAPSSVTYAGAGVTWPLAQNLYVSSGSAYLSTTAAVISGFGSSSSGPSLTADNSYATGSATFTPTVTILYKTGTSTQIEETSIPVTSVGTGSGNGLRVINPGSTDTPVISANTAFNSQTSTLQTYDTTVVAAVLKHDQVNYSTGYLPVGPNLSSGRTGDQYFTFRFTRTVVSKFDISITGNVAGCFVALPGSTIDSTSTLNGWIDMSVAYAGSGVPGANTGAGGNGSNGCALGGVFTTNSSVTQSKTCTFGTVSSSSTASNEIFVRLRLVAGQTVTALSIVTATH